MRPVNALILAKGRVIMAACSKTSTEDTETTENTDFSIFYSAFCGLQWISGSFPPSNLK